jgi:hypothetical protein
MSPDKVILQNDRLESVLSNTNRAELYQLSWFFAKTMLSNAVKMAGAL